MICAVVFRLSLRQSFDCFLLKNAVLDALPFVFRAKRFQSDETLLSRRAYGDIFHIVLDLVAHLAKVGEKLTWSAAHGNHLVDVLADRVAPCAFALLFSHVFGVRLAAAFRIDDDGQIMLVAEPVGNFTDTVYSVFPKVAFRSVKA